MAGRKKLFKTYLLEHLTSEERKSVTFHFFKDLKIEEIPTVDNVGKLVFSAEDIFNKRFNEYYVITGYSWKKGEEFIFDTKHIGRNTCFFYQKAIVIIPEMLIRQSIKDQFLHESVQWRNYRHKEK